MANLTPQAKRLIILGLFGIVLVGGAIVVNNYLLAPAPPPPAPPVRPVLPPPPRPPAATPAPAPAPASYALQVGAFAVKTNAEKLQKRLEEKGYAVAVRPASPRLPRHRVLVGEYTAQADAEGQREKVVAAGVKGAKVVPTG